MKSAWRQYLQRNVPRYTSYPSALSFSEAVGPQEYSATLTGLASDEPVSLYIHVPFCAQLCWYCGCNMRVENRYERARPFVDALLKEIEAVAGHLGSAGQVSQIHFGGGTPNFLSNEDLQRIVTKVRDAFRLNDETKWAIELDPRQSRADDISRLAEMGFSRMSIGVQDFDSNVQKAINRVQPYEMIEATVAAMRHAGVDDISFDLLYGLPLQKIQNFSRTIQMALSLSPDRISLFGYAHMPTRLKHQRLIKEEDLPEKTLRATLAEYAADQMTGAGYQRIGFDHFARPETAIAIAARTGSLNRNFQGFTEDKADNVIGFGPSAISSVGGHHFQNQKDVVAYGTLVDAQGLATDRGVLATGEERAIGRWIKTLLCRHRASLGDYFEMMQVDRERRHQIVMSLQPLIEDGLVELDDTDICIAKEAESLARVVASIFDPAVTTTKEFASPAV